MGVFRKVVAVVLSLGMVSGPAFAHSSGGFPPDLGTKSGQKGVIPDPGTFVNYESAHVHPLDINPSGTLLAAVNTADARVELFSIDGGGAITHSNSIPVGVDPVSARFRNDTELWVVNFISDSVTIVDATTGNVVKTFETDDEPADVIFFIDAGNSDELAAVSCSRVDLIQIYDADTCALVDELDILGEDPRALATNGSDVFGAIFNSGNSTTIIGHVETDAALTDNTNPYSGLSTPRQPFNNGVPGTAWVTPGGSKDLTDLSNEGKPAPPRVGIIVRKDFNDGNKWKDDNGADWTDWVSGAKASMSARLPGWDMIDNDIFSFSTSSGASSLDGAFGSSGYVVNRMNICMAIGVNPVDGSVVMVGTDATNEVRFEPVVDGRFIRVLAAIANPTTGAEIALVDMNETHLEAAQSGVGTAYEDGTVPQADRDKSIGDPRGIAFHPTRGDVYVTGMGSNNVVVLDNSTGARLGSVGHTVEVPAGPTGAVHHPSLDRLYVQSKFAASVSVVNTTAAGSETVVQTAEYYDPTPSWVNDGRVHFYDTHLNSGLGHISCASCHIDGQMDRLAWDLGDPLGEMKLTDSVADNLGAPLAGEHNLSFSAEGVFDDFHFMKGPMTTQTLQDIIGKEPHHWRGDRDGIEEFAGAFAGLQGRDAPLDAASMQEFENFLSTIHFGPNPFRAVDNSLPGGPKFIGAGTNPSLPLPNHFTSGRFAPEGSPLPDGDAWRGFQLYVDGNPLDASPPLDNPFNCVTCHSLPMGAGSIDFFNGSTFVDIAAGPNGEAHQSLVAVDGTGEKAFKTPHLRNQLDKVGLFMGPNPLDSGNPHLSRAGFGVLHDGSIAGLDSFLASIVFDMESDQDVADVVAFTLCINGDDFADLIGLSGGPTGFPAGVVGSRDPGPDGGETLTAHAGVGKQITIDTSTPSTTESDQIDLFIAMADAGMIDLVVKGVIGSDLRGWYYNDGAKGVGEFESDQQGVSHTLGELLGFAGSGTELSFTVVPEGTGVRMGVDRDEDGVWDFTELLNGTNPADPSDGVFGLPMNSWWRFALALAILGAGVTTFRVLARRKRLSAV